MQEGQCQADEPGQPASPESPGISQVKDESGLANGHCPDSPECPSLVSSRTHSPFEDSMSEADDDEFEAHLDACTVTETKDAAFQRYLELQGELA